MEFTATDLRVRLVQSGVKQFEVAARLPMDETLLSRYLNGRREMPEGFAARFIAVVDEIAGERGALAKAA